LVTTLVTLNLKVGGKGKLIPSVASKANNTCDIVTDVVAVCHGRRSLAVSFYSSESCISRTALGLVGWDSQYETADNYFVKEGHDLHIPVYGEDADKLIYVWLGGMSGEGVPDEDVTLRIAVQS
jgi:hypothetical protein